MHELRERLKISRLQGLDDIIRSGSEEFFEISCTSILRHINAAGNWCQEDLAPAQRSVSEWLLLAVCGGKYFISYPSEKEPDF